MKLCNITSIYLNRCEINRPRARQKKRPHTHTLLHSRSSLLIQAQVREGRTSQGSDGNVDVTFDKDEAHVCSINMNLSVSLNPQN